MQVCRCLRVCVLIGACVCCILTRRTRPSQRSASSTHGARVRSGSSAMSRAPTWRSPPSCLTLPTLPSDRSHSAPSTPSPWSVRAVCIHTTTSAHTHRHTPHHTLTHPLTHNPPLPFQHKDTPAIMLRSTHCRSLPLTLDASALLSAVAQDLKHALTGGVLADVTLVTSSRRLPAHRAILSRSPMFKGAL